MIISSQYNYDFFSIFIVTIYSFFSPSYGNLFLVFLFFIILFFKYGSIDSSWLYLLGMMFVLVLLFAKFKNKKQEEESGGYDDLLKMLGK